jgi:Icc-related predicted phosphoesterase
MIDVQELLKQKENDIIRVRKEIDALHLVSQILSEPDEAQSLQHNADSETAVHAVPGNENGEHIEGIDASNGRSIAQEDLSEPISPKRGILRDWFKRAAGE